MTTPTHNVEAGEGDKEHVEGVAHLLLQEDDGNGDVAQDPKLADYGSKDRHAERGSRWELVFRWEILCVILILIPICHLLTLSFGSGGGEPGETDIAGAGPGWVELNPGKLKQCSMKLYPERRFKGKLKVMF